MKVVSPGFPIRTCSASLRTRVEFRFRSTERRCPAHFKRFRETRSSPGLIIVSQELDIGAVIEDMLLIWLATDVEEWIEQIGFVPV